MPNDASKAEFAKAKDGGEMYLFHSVADIAEYSDPALFEAGRQEFTFGSGEGAETRLETWAQFKERTEKEWANGIRVFSMFVEQLTSANLPETKDKKRRTRFGTEGDDIDFDRMRNGETNFWRKSERDDSTGPTTMTVVIDTTTPYTMQSEDILWRGAAGVALAKILEERGWGCEIWVVNGSTLYSGEETPVYTACCLKRPSDPLDISTLINTVSGWFYRTGTFTLIKTICKNRMKKLAWGYGTCATPTEEDLDLLSPDEYRIYYAGVFTFDGAISIITSQLEKIRLKGVEDGGE